MNFKELNLEELTAQDMLIIEGGSFWYDVAYAIGYTFRAASDISSSLRNDPRHGDANVYK
ncbi:hypothetical protein [Pedobacter sp. KACC 23697]|uniref:Bacteriocin n=1 Tax=Pedobacter sp. KACC 23697 TaxID=3149230 RepID=A0AAU7K203_9SPHI